MVKEAGPKDNVLFLLHGVGMLQVHRVHVVIEVPNKPAAGGEEMLESSYPQRPVSEVFIHLTSIKIHAFI